MKRSLILLIIISMLFAYCPEVFANYPIINSQAYILIDSKTGQVLCEYNADQKLYPASTTKIMTAILGIEKGELNQIMTASKAAVDDIGKDGMNIGIMAGEEMRLEDLLNVLLVTSANETANIIAENLSPTRKEFVELMNKRAKELGAENTNFVNPCGAHNSNHYSTARDLMLFSRHAMTIPKFREIVIKDSYNLPSTNKHETWGRLPVTNKLINSKSDYFTKVTGIKTGSTGEAGNNLVSSAVNKDGTELLAVVLGVRGPGSEKNIFSYSKELLEYGFRNFSSQRLASAEQVIKNVSVLNSKNNDILYLVLQNNLDLVLPNDKSTWNIEENEYINLPIVAPVTKGDVLGYKEYKRNGISIGTINIIASQSIEQKPKPKAIDKAVDKAVNIFKNPILIRVIISVFAILLAFIALRLVLKYISRKRKSKRQ